MSNAYDIGRRPGVNIIEELNSALAISSVTNRTVGLIAPSFSTILVKDIAITRGSGSSDNIGTYTAEQINEVKSVSKYLGAYGTNRATYIENTDFAVDGNTVVWDEYGDSPVAGSIYYVSVVINKLAADYIPTRYTDIVKIKQDFGPEYDGTNINELVVASRIILAAGAASVIVCQCASSALNDVDAALTKFNGKDIQYLVVTPGTTTEIRTAIRTHVLDQSSTEKGLRQVAFVGATADATVDTIVSEASALKDGRMIMIAPSKVKVLVEDTSGIAYEKWVPSVFAGCALAGLLANSGRKLTKSFTNQDLTGLGIIELQTEYLDTEISALAASGVTVLFNDYGYSKVNQGLTTDNTNYAKYQANVVVALDETMRRIKKAANDSLVGTEVTATVEMDVTTFFTTLLNSLKGILFTDWIDLVVTRDTVNPLKVNVRFSLQPTWSMDYIDIYYSVIF